MQISISEWLETNTHESKRQMALRVGQSPSTFNRNIETFEIIVAVCREYGLNPIEALVAAQLIEDDDVESYAQMVGLQDEIDDLSDRDILERIGEYVEELGSRMDAMIPLPGQTTIFDVRTVGDPDYSNMSDEDAKDYGLAAKPEDEHIAHDELPNQP